MKKPSFTTERANMFVWPAIFCLAAASGAFGLPGAIRPQPASHDVKFAPGSNASETIDVSGIKTRIRLLLEQTLDVGDKKAVSNSTTLYVQVEKRDVKCDASESQCDCLSGQCDCSKGQCSCSDGKCPCPAGCPDKKQANSTEQPAVRIEREAGQKVETTTKGTLDDDDDNEDDVEDKRKIKTNAQDDLAPDDISGGYEGLPTRKSDSKENIKQDELLEDDDDEEDKLKITTDSQGRDIPKAMLNRERQLYIRSLSEEYKEGDVVKREAPRMADDWVDELLGIGWKEEKPAYKHWDFLYPKMNQVRLSRETAKKGKPDASSTKNDAFPPTKQVAIVTKAESNATSKDDALTEIRLPIAKEPGDKVEVQSSGSAPSTEAIGSHHVRVKRSSEQALAEEVTKVSSTLETDETKTVSPELSITSTPKEPATDLTHASNKKEDVSAKQVRELPKEEQSLETNEPSNKKSDGSDANLVSESPKDDESIETDTPSNKGGDVSDDKQVEKSPKGEKSLETDKPTKGGDASGAKQVRELPKEDQPPKTNEPETNPEVDNTPIKEETPEQVAKTEKAPMALQGSNGHNEQDNAPPAVAEPKGYEAKKRLKSGLESSWGSDTHDSEEWQKARRLGDTRSAPADFGNLDIRYLGGNDLNIPPVDISNFHPDQVTGYTSGESLPPESSVMSAKADLGTQSASGLNMASFGVLLMALVLVTAFNF